MLFREEKIKIEKRKLNSLTFIMSFMIILFFVILLKNENVDANSNEQVIKTYYDNINSKNYSELYKLFSDKYLQETRCVYDNAENVENHVGIFDIKSARVIDVSKETDLNKFELQTYDTNGVDVYSVSVDMEVYTGEDCFCEGKNICYFLFDSAHKIVGCWKFDEQEKDEESKTADGISLTSYDTPVPNVHSNPKTIKVLYKNKVQEVEFKKYVKVVEKNEVGYSTWKLDALKACAVAIKNYGVVRIKRHKYAGQGYDVKSTTADQVYNPGKENIAICDKAVDDIWGVIWLDADSKVFPGFHVDSKAVDSHAVRNGGILSQHGAQKLAKDNGYSWVDILRYYYDRKKNIAYYNPEVAVGTTTFVNGL